MQAVVPGARCTHTGEVDHGDKVSLAKMPKCTTHCSVSKQARAGSLPSRPPAESAGLSPRPQDILQNPRWGHTSTPPEVFPALPQATAQRTIPFPPLSAALAGNDSHPSLPCSPGSRPFLAGQHSVPSGRPALWAMPTPLPPQGLVVEQKPYVQGLAV